jgi:nitroreductase
MDAKIDILEAIHTRRSIRKFAPDAVPEEKISTMLAAAMTAPSAGNAQPWQFLVIDEREILDKVAGIHPYVGMFKQAPLGILVCGDLNKEKFPGYWVQDCAAAVQNLLLAARGLGLGTVWTGLCPVEERMQAVQEMFALPDAVKPHALIAVGTPLQEFKHQNRYKAENVHRNRW